jgi:ankyrin repeat protein
LCFLSGNIHGYAEAALASLKVVAQQKLSDQFSDKLPEAIATRLRILLTLNKLFLSVFSEDDLSESVNGRLKSAFMNDVKQSIHSASDVAATNRHKMTALHIASMNGHSQALERLMASNADLCVLDKDGQSPLDLANNQGCSEVLRAAGADGWTPLMIAANKGQAGAIREMLADSTGNLSAATRSGWSALHLAAVSGSVEAVRVLVDAGADLNVRNADGYTPLDLTTDEECCEVLEILGASRSPALLPGQSVKLAVSYRQFADAAEGPLHPGDVGTVVKDDGSGMPYAVRVADGRQWYYCRPALVAATQTNTS